MATELTFILVQKAKKTGGDRYACTDDPDFAIYIPQEISREGDVVHTKLKITVEPVKTAPKSVKVLGVKVKAAQAVQAVEHDPDATDNEDGA